MGMDFDTFIKRVGERVRTLRKSKRLSQEKLAELSDLHPVTVSDIERGVVDMKLSTLYATAASLGVTFAELLTIPDEKDVDLLTLVAKVRELDERDKKAFLLAAEGLLRGMREP